MAPVLVDGNGEALTTLTVNFDALYYQNNQRYMEPSGTQPGEAHEPVIGLYSDLNNAL